jgi:hypothetical protein
MRVPVGPKIMSDARIVVVGYVDLERVKLVV